MTVRSVSRDAMANNTKELRVHDRGRVTIPKAWRQQHEEPGFYIAELEDGKIVLTPARLTPASGD